MTLNCLHSSDIPGLERIHIGKVRDIYAVDDEHLLIVATDRLSAFDVIMDDPIPGKGGVLTRVSRFWFDRFSDVVRNHIAELPLKDVLPDPSVRDALGDRAMVVRRLKPLPVEAIARGYLIGSGWKDYQATGAICGIELPAGLRQGERLPEVIFTPSTKAAAGSHDENISFAQMSELLGEPLADQVRDVTVKLYSLAAEYAATRGIIIADTKFELAQDADGELVLIDEVLTPDSSRFWPAEDYAPGMSPPSFDKQFVRDYLETLDWPKQPPPPPLPAEIIERTAAKYAEAERRLCGPER